MNYTDYKIFLENHFTFLETNDNPSFSPSSIVSNKGLPCVSGRISDISPAANAAPPKNSGA